MNLKVVIPIEWPLLLIGLIVSFVGTLFGGGGLIGMPSMLLYGIPIHTIIAANKFSNMISSFSSFYVLFKKREICLKEMYVLVPIALFSGGIGALIAKWMSEQLLTVVAFLLLTLSFILSFVPKQVEKQEEEKVPIVHLSPYLFSIGMYDGMFGPGQATLLMMTYIRHHFSYLRAIALSRCQTFISCLGAFIIFQASGLVNWSVAIPLSLGSFIGAQISVRFAKHLKLPVIKIVLQIVTGLFIVHLSYSFLLGGM